MRRKNGDVVEELSDGHCSTKVCKLALELLGDGKIMMIGTKRGDKIMHNVANVVGER